MPLDLQALASTPDIRTVPVVQARLVCALRYIHIARNRGCYCADELSRHLGAPAAVRRLHVFLSEACQAWPDPIALGPPCQPWMTYDEMLLVDCATAAARGDRAGFDTFLREMIGEANRRSLWFAARRLMAALGVPAGPERDARD